MIFPKINRSLCKNCGICAENCPTKILTLNNNLISFINNGMECQYCGQCEESCPNDAIKCPLRIIVK